MVQVPPGLMRNKWYPRRMAVYVTPAELEVMGSRKIVAPPDGSYGSRTVAVQAPVGLSSEPKEVKKPRKERVTNPARADILSVRLCHNFPQMRGPGFLTTHVARTLLRIVVASTSAQSRILPNGYYNCSTSSQENITVYTRFICDFSCSRREREKSSPASGYLWLSVDNRYRREPEGHSGRG
jgi:hypothetical protein